MIYCLKVNNDKKPIPDKIINKYKRYLSGNVEQMVQTWMMDFRIDVANHFKITLDKVIIVKCKCKRKPEGNAVTTKQS